MRKPKPPTSQFPIVDGQTPSLPVVREDISFGKFPPPSAGGLEIGDVSPIVEPMEAPVLGAASGQTTKLACASCANCWEMEIAGQFKNKKSDGSEFMLTERFCMFGTKKDALISLAERQVYNCSRYEKKED